MPQAPGYRQHPDHDIAVKPLGTRLQVLVGEILLADTASALVLEEAGYPPRYYIPADHVHRAYLRPSDARSYCPFKGEARYFHLATDDVRLPDAAWCYPAPYDEHAAIGGHVAFYGEHSDIQYRFPGAS